MGKELFKNMLLEEIKRIDALAISKRHEKVIEGFSNTNECPRAIIEGKDFLIFNSNDYLGLRFNNNILAAAERGAVTFGKSPGAVRFISGTTQAHKDLEKSLSIFHGKQDAMVFSSAFSANVSVLHALLKGQSAGSLVSADTLVISDELNHRSIIEGVRVANFTNEQKKIFKHMDYTDLENILIQNKGKFLRVVIATDGIFSMLGEAQDIKKIKTLAEKYDEDFEQGIIVIVDDAHGVGCFGPTGRGCEEVFGAESDILVGTLGKAFGAEGGYVTADKIFIDYLRESAASYIYSNSISGAGASAGIEAIRLMSGNYGTAVLKKLQDNITFFKQKAHESGLIFANNSNHPIQPILIGDPLKTKKIAEELFKKGFLVTALSHPIVPAGKDEIRVQLSASHNESDIEQFVSACAQHYIDSSP